MTKEELRGFVRAIIDYDIMLNYIAEEKMLTFSLYELEHTYLIELSYLIVDVPSSNQDPCDDNSVEKIKTIKIKPSKNFFNKDLIEEITSALDEVREDDLITERSEL